MDQTHAHSKSPPSMRGGDGPFRQKLPNTIRVLKAQCARQMDKVGGYFFNPGLFRRHGNVGKMNMNDHSSKCITRLECIFEST